MLDVTPPPPPPPQSVPFSIEVWCGEDFLGNACSMDGWVGVEWADDDLQLGLHCLGFSLTTGEYCKTAHPLTCV